MESWQEHKADGTPVPIVCTGGQARHHRRVLGRFQHFAGQRDGDGGWSEVYADGIPTVADQYLVESADGQWVPVEEEDTRQAIIRGASWRTRWSRSCPKCGRHFVFDSETLDRAIHAASTHGMSSIDLSRSGL